MNVRALVCAFSLLAATSSTAFATPITYNYTGTVNSSVFLPSGIFAGQGTNVTGTFTFDDALVDEDTSGTFDQFRPDLAANLSSNNVWEITLNLGAVSVTTATNARPAGTFHHRFTMVDSDFDQFLFGSSPISSGDDGVSLLLLDESPSPPDGISAGTDSLTSTISGAISILNSLDPADFSNNGGSRWVARSPSNSVEGTVDFRLTSISPAQAVPEPASLLLFGTGLAAAGIRRYRRKQ